MPDTRLMRKCPFFTVFRRLRHNTGRPSVEFCLGARPSQAAKSRPLGNGSLVPTAAIIAVEMIGPTPGTITGHLQWALPLAIVKISKETVLMIARSAIAWVAYDRFTNDTVRSREKVSSGGYFVFTFSDAMG